LAARINQTGRQSDALSRIAARLRRAREVESIDLTGRSQTSVAIRQVDDLWVGPSGEILVVDSTAGIVANVVADSNINKLRDTRGIARWVGGSVQRIVGAANGTLLATGRTDTALLFKSKARAPDQPTRVVLGGRPEDGCSLDNTLYIRVPTARRLVTRVTSDGRVIGAFGEPYRATADHVKAVLSRGLIACAPGADTIIAMFNAFPEIYGFGRDGAVRWISRFDSFRRPRLTEADHGGHTILIHSQPEVADRLAGLVEFESRYVIVQLMRVSPDQDKRPHVVHTYIVDATNGAGEYVGESLPLIQQAHGSALYSAVRKPTLRLVVYSDRQH
jgi:hypothetical protein